MVMAELARPPDGRRRIDVAAPEVYLVIFGDGRLAESVAARLRSGLQGAGLARSVLVPPVRGAEFFTAAGHRRVAQWWSAQRLEDGPESAVLVAKDEEELAGVGQRTYLAVRPGRLAGCAGTYGPSVVEVPAAKVSDLVRSVVARERSLRVEQVEPVAVRGETARPFSVPALPQMASAARALVGQRRRASTVMLALALGVGGWVVSSALQPGEASADPGGGVQGARGQPPPQWRGGGEIPHRGENVGQQQREALQRLREIGRKIDQGRVPGRQGHIGGNRPPSDAETRQQPRHTVRQKAPQRRQVAQQHRQVAPQTRQAMQQRRQVAQQRKQVARQLRQAMKQHEQATRRDVPRVQQVDRAHRQVQPGLPKLPGQLAKLGLPKAQLPMAVEGGGTKVRPIPPVGSGGMNAQGPPGSGGVPGSSPVAAQAPGYVDPLPGSSTQPPPVKLYEPPDYTWEYPNGKSRPPSTDSPTNLVPDPNKWLMDQVILLGEIAFDVTEGAFQGAVTGGSVGGAADDFIEKGPKWARALKPLQGRLRGPGMIVGGVIGGVGRLYNDTDGFSRPFDPKRSTVRQPGYVPFAPFQVQRMDERLRDLRNQLEKEWQEGSEPEYRGRCSGPASEAPGCSDGQRDQGSSTPIEPAAPVTPSAQPIAAPEPAPVPQPQPVVVQQPEPQPYVDPMPAPTPPAPQPAPLYEPPVYQTTPQSTGSGGGWTGPGAVAPDTPTPPPGSQSQVVPAPPPPPAPPPAESGPPPVEV